jgi:hypothetical protein
MKTRNRKSLVFFWIACQVVAFSLLFLPMLPVRAQTVQPPPQTVQPPAQKVIATGQYTNSDCPDSPLAIRLEVWNIGSAGGSQYSTATMTVTGYSCVNGKTSGGLGTDYFEGTFSGGPDGKGSIPVTLQGMDSIQLSFHFVGGKSVKFQTFTLNVENPEAFNGVVPPTQEASPTPGKGCSPTVGNLSGLKPGDTLSPSVEFSDPDGNPIAPISVVWYINGQQTSSITWDGKETTLELQYTCPDHSAHTQNYTVAAYGVEQTPAGQEVTSTPTTVSAGAVISPPTPVPAGDCLSDPLNAAGCMSTPFIRQGAAAVVSVAATLAAILVIALGSTAAAAGEAGGTVAAGAVGEAAVGANTAAIIGEVSTGAVASVAAGAAAATGGAPSATITDAATSPEPSQPQASPTSGTMRQAEYRQLLGHLEDLKILTHNLEREELEWRTQWRWLYDLHEKGITDYQSNASKAIIKNTKDTLDWTPVSPVGPEKVFTTAVEKFVGAVTDHITTPPPNRATDAQILAHMRERNKFLSEKMEEAKKRTYEIHDELQAVREEINAVNQRIQENPILLPE